MARWKVYKRGEVFRVGRKRWWGMQWHKWYSIMGGFTVNYRDTTEACRVAAALNKVAYEDAIYRADDWNEIKCPQS